ncbi:hypothetical protein LRP88_12797 [Fusarium phalaenopsidis]
MAFLLRLTQNLPGLTILKHDQGMRSVTLLGASCRVSSPDKGAQYRVTFPDDNVGEIAIFNDGEEEIQLHALFYCQEIVLDSDLTVEWTKAWLRCAKIGNAIKDIEARVAIGCDTLPAVNAKGPDTVPNDRRTWEWRFPLEEEDDHVRTCTGDAIVVRIGVKLAPKEGIHIRSLKLGYEL